MNRNMKNRYRVFRRGWGTFYCEDLVTRKQESLKTRYEDEAFHRFGWHNVRASIVWQESRGVCIAGFKTGESAGHLISLGGIVQAWL